MIKIKVFFFKNTKTGKRKSEKMKKSSTLIDEEIIV